MPRVVAMIIVAALALAAALLDGLIFEGLRNVTALVIAPFVGVALYEAWKRSWTGVAWALLVVVSMLAIIGIAILDTGPHR